MHVPAKHERARREHANISSRDIIQLEFYRVVREGCASFIFVSYEYNEEEQRRKDTCATDWKRARAEFFFLRSVLCVKEKRKFFLA